jgi:hypothetical protein
MSPFSLRLIFVVVLLLASLPPNLNPAASLKIIDKSLVRPFPRREDGSPF